MKQTTTPEPVAKQINPLTLRFIDPEHERAYWRFFVDQTLPLLKAATVFSTLILIAVGFGEKAVFPQLYEQIWWIRYGYIVPVAAASIPFMWVPSLAQRVTREHFPTLVLTFSSLVMAGLYAISFVLMTRNDNITSLFFGLAYLLTLQGLFIVIRLQFAHGVAMGLGTLACIPLGLALAGYGLDRSSIFIVGFGCTGNALGLCGLYYLEHSARQQFLLVDQLAEERQRADELVRSILPDAIADRLQSGEARIADGHEDVSVLFADIVGFAALSARLPAERLLRRLDELFSTFDDLTARAGAEKIKTLGDSYMAATGVPHSQADHAALLAALGHQMLDAVSQMRPIDGLRLQLRVGIHSGPAVAGVIGRHRFAYDLWGDTVNTAARMESYGAAGKVHVSASTAAQLGQTFRLESRGEMEIKGKGRMTTFFAFREEPDREAKLDSD